MKKLTPLEIDKRIEKFPDWEYVDNLLYNEFEFDSFKNCMSAMMRIAFECEVLNHHPTWSNTYNILEIKLSTHDVHGVTELDFKLLEAIENIIEAEE